jgi:hypothetical protein
MRDGKKNNTATTSKTQLPRFVSDIQVEEVSGISRRTLRHDRLLGRPRFPHYKVGGRCLYDLDEVIAIIRSNIRNVPPASTGV